MGEAKQFKEYEGRVDSINRIEPEMELLDDAELRAEAEEDVPGFSKRDIQTFAERLSSRCFFQLTALTGPPKSSDARVFTSTNATVRPVPPRSALVATRSMSRRPFLKRRSAISQP